MEEGRLLVSPMRIDLNVLFSVIFLQSQAQGFGHIVTTTNNRFFHEGDSNKCFFSAFGDNN